MTSEGVHVVEDRLEIGADIMPYRLRFSPRTTLKITVYPDASVYVEAPQGKSVEQVRARLRRKTQWILRHRDYFSRFQPRPVQKSFRSGETFVYLGRHYRLKVRVGRKHRAVLSGPFLNVDVLEQGSPAKLVKEAIANWYVDRAKDIFKRRLDRCHAYIKRLGVTLPRLTIRHMRRRWGSYTKAGSIILNSELIQAPTHCID